MVKTTVYLPAPLKSALGRRAAEEGRSEAALIREAISRYVEAVPRRAPRVPLGSYGLGNPDAAANADALLSGFGES